jgi:hypothetical protein
VDETGTFHVRGLPEAPRFARQEDAEEYAVAELQQIVRELAREAGTADRQIEIVATDAVGTTADGSGVFLGRTLEARVKGVPEPHRMTAEGS